MREKHRGQRNWIGALAPLIAMALVASGCMRTPVGLNPAPAAATAGVKLTFHVPRKQAKPTRHLLATGDIGSVLANKVNVALSGAGFYEPVYPDNSNNGEIVIGSDSVSSTLSKVPTGKNRYIKVTAWNSDKKLHKIGGVLDVVPGPYNHVTISMATTPTAEVVEKLARLSPEQAALLDARKLQHWLDTHVTKPVTGDATQQNKFNGLHPFWINTDGLVEHLASNALAIPDSFDPVASPAQAVFELQRGRVDVLTDPLPTGSKLWLDDPTSAVIETSATGLTNFSLTDVAPNFEAEGAEATPAWRLTVLTPDGRVTHRDLTVPRVSRLAPALASFSVDLRAAMQTISEILLTPTTPDWQSNLAAADRTVTLDGRVVQQLYAYARVAGQTQLLPILPVSLDWQVVDGVSPARVKVGNGRVLTRPELSAAMQAADANLADSGLDLRDYGLLYPLAETGTDTVQVKAALRGNAAIFATVKAKVTNLGATTGQVAMSAQVDALTIVPGRAPAQLTSMEDSFTLTAAEYGVAAGATNTVYRWIADKPAIVFDPPTGQTVNVKATGDVGTATLTVFSAKGRKASFTISTNFGAGVASGSAVSKSLPMKFEKLNGYNTGNADFTSSTSSAHPLGGWINRYGGKVMVAATDAEDATGGQFFWSSSDPSIINVTGSFPSRTATLSAHREGYVTLTIMDLTGRKLTSGRVYATFATGTASGSITVPSSNIELVGASEASIGADLNQLYLAKTYEATERGQASPLFTWLSLDPSMLEITPPSGEVFPNAKAVFKPLRPGTVSFKLVSGRTGATRVFTLTIAFANGTGAGTITASGLAVRQTAPTVVTSGTAVSKNLGQTVTLQATDPTDPSPVFAWRSENPDVAAFLNHSGDSAQFKLLGYGSTRVRVVNTRNGRFGWIQLDLLNTGRGTGNVTVTL